MTGVSFVVPVRNGAASIAECLDAIFAQADGRPMEVIVVDDGSRDGSAEELRRIAAARPLRLLAGEGRGAAAALNTGVRAARFPIVCQVDQDVVLQPEWMRRLVDRFDDPLVAAAQGYYATDPRASLCARIMGLDLEQRYGRIDGDDTDHVCTGNVAYRAGALHAVGLFEEALGYGYDNDLSYRLGAAGHRLVICRDARSLHRWREGLHGYLRQQYGFGYGRLDLLARHPHRFRGDAVSPAGMMAHPVVMSAALAALGTAASLAWRSGAWQPVLSGAAGLLAVLAVERLAAGAAAARRFGDPAALLFPFFHLARDLAWVAAIVVWCWRRIRRREPAPSHSMSPRPVSIVSHALGGHGDRPGVLCLIPAHNEAANLAHVVGEVRACRPDLDILVVDDGSSDDTPLLVKRLGVRWLRLPHRMGIGTAMRAGLRYASRLGYAAAVRIDGDGQHRADDIAPLLALLQTPGTDVVIGSRYWSSTARPASGRLSHQLLAAVLTALTRGRVTDPTSGFCAFGPRALELLAEHHPTGYGEPELRLFLSRNGLGVREAAVSARARYRGRTSLTVARMASAAARVALALVIVPFRPRVGRAARG